MLVGIDLGTTNSAISVLKGNPARPQLISIGGQTLLPSIVSFEKANQRPLVGHTARNRFVFDPDNTIREAKRNMGRDTIYQIHDKAWTAPEIQAEVLKYLIENASEQLGEKIDRAVITVPAYFTQHQREETRKSGELAGLTVERLLNEPTAAALAYHPEGGARNVLIYDLGGGTFDVSLVRMDGSLVEVQSSHGDTQLGGRDFDQKLAIWLLEQFAETLDSPAEEVKQAVYKDSTAMARLLILAEETKIRLSKELEVEARCEFLLEIPKGQARHLSVAVSREEFTNLIQDDLDRAQQSIMEVFESARCDLSDIDEILLVGGSTRIPAVAEKLREEFGLEPSRGINPDECVALGAAVQAGIMEGIELDKVLVDVAPYSLSIAVLNPTPTPFMSCKVITPRNTPLPAHFSERFSAISAYQNQAHVHIFQGGHEDPRHNRCLGRLELTGLERRQSEDVPKVHVTFKTNLDGLVDVTLVNPGSGKKKNGKFTTAGSSNNKMMDEYLDSLDGILPYPPGSEAPNVKDLELLFGSQTKKDAQNTEQLDEDEDWIQKVDPALSEETMMLKRILKEKDRLDREHPNSQIQLLALINEAKKTLSASPVDAQAVQKSMDALSDWLFDLGEFI